MQLTLHATAIRAWCTRYLPGWVKPDVLRPSIVGMRGSTAMHDMGTHMHDNRTSRKVMLLCIEWSLIRMFSFLVWVPLAFFFPRMYVSDRR